MNNEGKPKEKLEKVVSSKAVVKKESLSKRIFDSFDVRGTSEYVMDSVVVPRVKELIFDVVTKGLERFIFGDSRPVNSFGSGIRRSTVYHTASSNNTPRVYQPSHRKKSFSQVTVGSRQDAEAVIESLRRRIRDYDVATVSDLYDLLDITWNYMDDKYGWTSLDNAEIRMTRDGYVLSLPEPDYID